MPSPNPPEPQAGRRIAAILAIAIGLDTVAQLLWKLVATRLPASLSLDAVVHLVVHQPLVLLLVGIFVLQLVNWLLVLERVDLSYAQPLTALSYVSVGLLSWWLLGEGMDGRKLVGILLVLAGVVLVSAGPMRRDRA